MGTGLLGIGMDLAIEFSTELRKEMRSVLRAFNETRAPRAAIAHDACVMDAAAGAAPARRRRPAAARRRPPPTTRRTTTWRA